jgi:hypothetical protein
MEHLLCECTHYSQLLWDRLGEVITRYLNADLTTYVPKVDITQLNIIYNVPHPSLLMYIPDKLTINSLLILMPELKRDIIYRRMNLPPSAAQVTSSQRLMMTQLD